MTEPSQLERTPAVPLRTSGTECSSAPARATCIRLVVPSQYAQSWLMPVTMSASSGQSSPRARPSVLHVGAVVRLHDERRLERQLDDDAEAGDGVVQLAVVGAGREAVADEEEVARGGELRAADEDARVVADFDPQIPHEELGVAALGQPHIPALIEIGFGAEPPHRVRNRKGQLAFIADLKQLDFTHHTLPQNCQSTANDSTQVLSSALAGFLSYLDLRRRPHMRINDDEVKGNVDKASGTVKEKFGRALGDPVLEKKAPISAPAATSRPASAKPAAK